MDLNLIFAITGIHNGKGLERCFIIIAIMSFVNIDFIFARTKVVFAKFEVIGNNFTIKFTMSKLNRIKNLRLFTSSTLNKMLIKFATCVFSRSLIIYKDSVCIIIFILEQVILCIREQGIHITICWVKICYRRQNCKRVVRLVCRVNIKPFRLNITHDNLNGATINQFISIFTIKNKCCLFILNFK